MPDMSRSRSVTEIACRLVNLKLGDGSKFCFLFVYTKPKGGEFTSLEACV